MAIGSFYDINRDMYFATPALSSQEQYERERYFRRKQEEERRMMQNMHDNPHPTGLTQSMLMSKAPVPDPKDPLAFLKKSDSKLLLTGKTS